MPSRRRLPRLMGAEEIRDRLGISRQWTYVIIGRKDFPDPVFELAMGKIWLASDVEAWIREYRPNLVDEPEGER